MIYQSKLRCSNQFPRSGQGTCDVPHVIVETSSHVLDLAALSAGPTVSRHHSLLMAGHHQHPTGQDALEDAAVYAHP
jgi:hypothetical protein